MSEIILTAHQMQRMDGLPTIVDPSTPPAKTAKKYRIKGTQFVINTLPPNARMEDLEEI